MKKLFSIIAFAVLFFSANAQNDNITPLEIGTEMPGGKIISDNATGKPINLDKAKKQNGLLVIFSSNTCPFVLKARARTRDMIALAKDKNIGVVIVNSNEAQRKGEDSYAEMKEYADKEKYDVPYLVDKDSKLADLFGATHTPEVFLFNREGLLIYHGAMEDNPRMPDESKEIYLQDAIEKYIMGELPEPSDTKSVGCSIKRK